MASKTTNGPLQVCKENPRYFCDNQGNPVYLTGSHTWNNLKDMGSSDPPHKFEYEGYLDYLAEQSHNFFRLWAWDYTVFTAHDLTGYVGPHAWVRTGPGEALDGKPKFDLTKFEQAFFDRMRSRVQLAREKGIYASVMLFEGWTLHEGQDPWKWAGHPFHKDNNINGIDGDPEQTGRGLAIQTMGIPEIVKLEEEYVLKVIDTVNGLDNVLYEIVNESGPYSTEWQYHLIDLIHEYEKGKPQQHPVGMTFQFGGHDENAPKGKNEDLFNSPAEWISPNPDGGYREDPPAVDGKKVILNDTDHLWGLGGNQAWVWMSFCRGSNPIFMDPFTSVKRIGPDGEPHKFMSFLDNTFPLDTEWDPIRLNMGYTRQYADKMDLRKCVPQNNLASSGYCLADPDTEYLVYLPEGEKLTVDLSALSGAAVAEWLDPDTNKTTTGEMLQGGEKATLANPFTGDAVLYLRKQ
jgi:hypothetical protein